jgi:hypothetical protein
VLPTLIAQEVERRLATAKAPETTNEPLVLGFQAVHKRYGISRKVWNQKIASGELQGLLRMMRGGHQGYLVPATVAARVLGGG